MDRRAGFSPPTQVPTPGGSFRQSRAALRAAFRPPTPSGGCFAFFRQTAGGLIGVPVRWPGPTAGLVFLAGVALALAAALWWRRRRQATGHSAQVWTAPGAAALAGLTADEVTDPRAVAAGPEGVEQPARFVGRLLWAMTAEGGLAFRLLAEAPDGSGEGLPVEGRCGGSPWATGPPSVPSYPITVEGLVHVVSELDRRGAYPRLVLRATRLDLRPRPARAHAPAARLRRAFEYAYLYNAREPRLHLRRYEFDPDAGALQVADWTTAGPGLLFALARDLFTRPDADGLRTLVFDGYDCPPAPAAADGAAAETAEPMPRLRFHARLRRERLRGLKWDRAYPSTLRLLADEWDQPRGLGQPDFRGIGGL